MMKYNNILTKKLYKITLPPSDVTSPIDSKNFCSDVPGVKNLKWYHNFKRDEEKNSWFDLGIRATNHR